jgi:hypothetical protein
MPPATPRSAPAATARGHRRRPRLTPGFPGVFDRCLRPDVTRLEVNAAAPVERVAFDDAVQLVKVDRQGPQHGRRTGAEHGIELAGQVVISVPASLPERENQMANLFGRAFNALDDGGHQAVSCQLEGVIVVAGALQQVDDSRSVAPVDSCPEGGIAAPRSPSSLVTGKVVIAAPRSMCLMVPVRFSPERLEEIRRRAEAEDRSVSSWIRRAVEHELDHIA